MTDTPKKPQRILPPAPPPGAPARPLAPGAGRNGPDTGKPGADSAAKTPDPTRFGDWEKNGRCIDF